MHPELLPALVALHVADLRRNAERHRRALDPNAHAYAKLPLRRRAGWWLVDLGLKLAIGRGAAPAMRTTPHAV